MDPIQSKSLQHETHAALKIEEKRTSVAFCTQLQQRKPPITLLCSIIIMQQQIS